MRILVSIIIFIVFSFGARAQELNRYRYVQVPEKFDFFDEANKYQLNALAAFLFEKYGFEALYREEQKVTRNSCDILSAKVFDESTMFRAKVYFTLEDCRGNVLFKSPVGVSKRKNYKESYQEALREAFESFKTLNYQYDPALKEAASSSEGLEEMERQEAVPEVIVDPVVPAREIQQKEEVASKNEKKSTSLQFTNGAGVYELKKTAVGYDLFKKGEPERFAKLVKTSGDGTYLYSSEGIQGSAFFKETNDLVVEFLNVENGQLLQLIYRSTDQ